jgi:pyruvate dehydrogenase E2 component (dihydrolipoamide acetyltransferase)
LPTNVIMPVLGMSQDKGKIIHWLKTEGDTIRAGELLLEIETDKAIEEIESPAEGILAKILTPEGEEVPVTQVIAVITSPGETLTEQTDMAVEAVKPVGFNRPSSNEPRPISATPVAIRMAAENKIDLQKVKPEGGKVEKADVLAYLAAQKAEESTGQVNARILASPKARRIALENGWNLAGVQGHGPSGAILAQDVAASEKTLSVPPVAIPPAPAANGSVERQTPSMAWRRMAERTTQSWTTMPHFYLQCLVNATRLLAWHSMVQKKSAIKITITDLLVFTVAKALTKHSRLNAIWQDSQIITMRDVNVSLAIAIEDGLVVPVFHQTDRLTPEEIAARRIELIERARSGRLMTEDVSGGTFTISNLGMYRVDAFNAVLNGPQAAILAVGRISDQVVPVHGQASIQPMMTLSISYDHRVIDGARGAQFLETLAEYLEEPLCLMN